MSWEIKSLTIAVAYNSKTDEQDERFERIAARIRETSQNGWEPWSMDISHAFSPDYTLLTTIAVAWFKRPK